MGTFTNAGSLLADVASESAREILQSVLGVEFMFRGMPGWPEEVAKRLKKAELARLKEDIRTQKPGLTEMERAIVVEAIHGLPSPIVAKETDELLKVIAILQDGTFAYIYASKKRYAEWKKADKKGACPRSLTGLVIDFFIKLTIRWPTQRTF